VTQALRHRIAGRVERLLDWTMACQNKIGLMVGEVVQSQTGWINRLQKVRAEIDPLKRNMDYTPFPHPRRLFEFADKCGSFSKRMGSTIGGKACNA
jgi:hypothetical protein